MTFPIARRRKVYVILMLIVSGLSATLANQYDCVNCSSGASDYMASAAPSAAPGLVYGNALANTVLMSQNAAGNTISVTTGFYADPSRDYYANSNAYISSAMVNADTFAARLNKGYSVSSIFGGTPFAPTAPAPNYGAPTVYSVLPQSLGAFTY